MKREPKSGPLLRAYTAQCPGGERREVSGIESGSERPFPFREIGKPRLMRSQRAQHLWQGIPVPAHRSVCGWASCDIGIRDFDERRLAEQRSKHGEVACQGVTQADSIRVRVDGDAPLC